jgi:peptidyl-prolyl cis-trans isomerase C
VLAKPPIMQLRLLILVVLSMIGAIAVACSGDDEEGQGSGAGGGTTSEEAPRTHGLTEEEAAQVLAKIGDREITVGEFAESIASKGPFLRARYNSPERRRELLDQMVRFELFAQEADRRGFDDLPEVQRTRKQVLIRRFLKQEFEDRIQLSRRERRKTSPAYFDVARTTSSTSPSRCARARSCSRSQATAQRVLAPDDREPERHADVPAARRGQHNTDPATRDRFGDIGFFSRPAERQADEPEVPPEVAEVAFSMDTIGTVHPELVHSSQGFHIVKITGRRAPLHRTLEEASRPIRHRLWRERREQAVEDLVTRLRSESDVHEDLSLLDQVQIDIPEGNYPAVLNDAALVPPPVVPPTTSAPPAGAPPSPPAAPGPSGSSTDMR